MSTAIAIPSSVESLAFVSPLSLIEKGVNIFALFAIEKLCARCESLKPAEDFSPHPGTRSGLQGHCKACRRGATRVPSREYARANPHVEWRADYRKRCARFGIAPVVEEFDRDDLVARDGGACSLCGAEPSADHKIVLDHVVPVAAGGPHSLANVQLLCGGPEGGGGCNGRKSREADAALIAAYREKVSV